MIWYTTLLPVGTLLLGAGLTEVRSWIADRRKRGEAERVAAAERLRNREARREAFELDLLVRLQAALLEYASATTRFHSLKKSTAMADGTYGQHGVISEDDFLTLYAPAQQVLALSSMVLDDRLRTEVRTVHAKLLSLNAMQAVPVEKAEAAHTAASERVGTALQAIAERLREIYMDGSTSLAQLSK